MKDYETPRELTSEDILAIIEDYVQAAKNVMAVGFDGVEFHAANGYLPHQFLAESSNLRTDKYGGSVENNCRFVLEVMERLVKEIGSKKISIKISPLQPYGDIISENPIKTYSYLIQELNKLDLAFVHLMKRGTQYEIPSHYPTGDEIEIFGKLTNHTLLANGGYDRDSGEAELQKGIADIIAYGTLFLANPDLPKRFELNAELNQPDYSTMFGGGEKGYTDYPFM
jgi:N-ethylmaleimide reductase